MQRQPERTIILASTSPYRRELLTRLGLAFQVVAPQVDEIALARELPRQTALRLAQAKALAVARSFPSAVVIGSDQVAEHDGMPLGKPETHPRAVAQLRRMRANTVVFHTAVCVQCTESGFSQTELAEVVVRFRDLSDAAIESYLQIEKPYDCAGSARCEGLGIALMESINSDDPTALVGLPLIRTSQMLRAAGIALL